MRTTTLRALWLLLLALVATCAAKKDQPDVSESTFDSPLYNLFYFEDSDVVIAVDSAPQIVYRSTDGGANWKKITDIKGANLHIRPHPYNNKVAVAMSTEKEHWITKDQGDTWSQFETKFQPMSGQEPVVFHATNPDKLIFLTQGCDDGDCTGQAMYTTDGAKTLHELRNKIVQCMWAKTTNIFTTGNEDHDEDQTLCIAEGRFSHYVKDNRLVVSNDYFKNEFEPPMDAGRIVQGHVNMAAVKGFIAVAAKSEGSLELVLYVTDDATTWHRAEFDGHRLEEDAYTILESTNYSIQVDVMTSRRDSPMGTLFTSNSNGTYFTKNIAHTNRNRFGIVDFEKIQNIQGLVLVNTIENWQDVERSGYVVRELITSMSFDDGRTWQPLKVKDEKLHLHSVTSQRNAGRIFSSPAPGLVMGVGNTGKFLKEWKECDTYVSDDAGVTWRKALSEPHLYEFGDAGAILVAVKDAATDKISYSINHGKDWKEYELEDKVEVITLQTVPDSTSLKFLLTGIKGTGSKRKHVSIFLDFVGLHESDCKDRDFENWPARIDSKGEATCVMGRKQFYRRRKADSDCFVDYKFKDPEPEFEECACTDADYECDYNFVKDEAGEKCIPAGPLLAPPDACKSGAETFKGSSGYRLIPGNECNRKDGVVKDEPIDRECKQTQKTPASGKIPHELTVFKEDSSVREYYYLEKTSDEHGDTIVMQTSSRKVYLTHDHGKTWENILPKEEVVAIYPHQYFKDVVYFITASKQVYYSYNQGRKIHDFEAPEGPNTERVQILSFHPTNKEWLLWIGGKDCDSASKCHTVAHVSVNGGGEWKTLLPYTKKCLFASHETRKTSEKLVYCEQYQDEDPSTQKLNLIASDDWFEHRTTHYSDVVSFATMSEFIVVARHDEKQHSLRVDTSVDGATFANAEFPRNFQVANQEAYTVLDSSTHAIFLHVTVNNQFEQEYGSIIKSNSNGTSYVLSINNVNRNKDAYVDFEKMQGLLGVAVINVVTNVEDLAKGAKKKLRTMITHDDGADWGYLNPPAKDSDGKSFDCKDSSIESCALHLHGYTERSDPRNTFSSPSAVGLMIGVGNVGPYLGEYKQGDTFITRDGGITWEEVFKGTYTWEYGDQGSVIVIVKQGSPVKEVFYTRDEGKTWTKYEFSDHDVIIDEISTVPADDSRDFILWGRDRDQLITINLDFSGLTDSRCEMDRENPDDSKSDYYLWRPTHPLSKDDCLFGSVTQYWRKKADRDCFNGKEFNREHNVSRICECARQDFECDYNYQRTKDGSCALVEGLQPADHSAICKENPDALDWSEPTGYRKIPLSKCQGGKELDSSTKHPCPGKEKEFAKKNGIGGWGVFFAIVIPVSVAAGVGYWVWNNWDGKFGRIRLGDGGPGMSSALDSDSPLVKYPVLAISGLVAVLAALPMLVGSVWRAAMNRFGRGGSYGYSRPYTSRGSFQRSRGDYAVVDEDEGELLGEESDEEV
ncbi:Oligoxyloglucan reducing end-specific cellobiohydrolase [Myriangium duriaei CBS 260.36]|uniref:Vacuolar protein sorting/targeting protein 10 n=1 Tax=Myriangium duriaei CBS 260.36 TaxID=1168546 RepID=A0A9P4MMQ7_9PEZI|nr:Oligoxyloglucan reducing end-specific cellobiohydrolase [Myriangium duriaei CBS 260.36]